MTKVRWFVILFSLIAFATILQLFWGVAKNNRPLVVMYETDLQHSNLKMLTKSLEKHRYDYKILTDDKWIAFGRKINKIHEFISNLPNDKLVIVCDARDVLAVNFDSDMFVRKLKSTVDYKSKVLVSTEIGCCVKTWFGPGQYRGIDGKVLKRSFDKSNTDIKYDAQWKSMFRERALLEGIKHPVKHKQSIYLNAGIYAGLAKNVCKIYDHMTIHEREDDQIIMSEVFYLRPEFFQLDYNRNFFSNSHVWDKNNSVQGCEDSGCYYTKDSVDNKIIDSYLGSKPFFIHTPGKHFNCYDLIATLSS